MYSNGRLDAAENEMPANMETICECRTGHVDDTNTAFGLFCTNNPYTQLFLWSREGNNVAVQSHLLFNIHRTISDLFNNCESLDLVEEILILHPG
jgi:hypothetical protein